MAITGRAGGDPPVGIATPIRVTSFCAGITVHACMRLAMAYMWGHGGITGITGITVTTVITIAATTNPARFKIGTGAQHSLLAGFVFH